MPTTSTNIVGVDLDAVADWMAGHDLGGGPIEAATPVGGGTQNIMVRLRRGSAEYILRRGPAHLRSGSNRGIEREMRLLAALDATAVPHPRLIAGSADPEVIGASFYLMEAVDGFNAAETLDAPVARRPEDRRELGFALVDALGEIAAVDHDRIGLGDFGRPAGFLERQVPRWSAEFDSYAQLPGYPGPRFRGLDTIAAWLDANRPNGFRPGILHGDFHIANVLYDRQRPTVAAVVDWEMATIGDPLLDLGVLMAIWPTEAGGADLYDSALGRAGDLPARAEILARYAAATDRDLTAIDWYRVLACFKLGIILEGSYARACAGRASPTVGERLRRYADALIEGAHRTIAEA